MLDDLSSVSQVIDYLLKRLDAGQIYTWIGTVLLAINPNDENISTNMYNSSQVDDYRNVRTTSCRELEAHIFALAAMVHYRLIQDHGKPSQVIILNGETGTGKTFNAWKALEFLVAIRNTPADVQEVDVSYDIMRKIKDAYRLISAFTTAPTEKNEVSSRHVQVVWLEYKKNNICGAKIASYLLERTRVTKGRCTYQIFNQMMTSLGNIAFADTGLKKKKQYFIVSDLNLLAEQQFRDGFRDTLRAMDMLDFTIHQKKNIFQVLSLIIHMGNIQFIQKDDCYRIDTDSEQSREAFENTCRLACLKKKDLAELLTSTLISPQNVRRRLSTCRRSLSTKDACRQRLHSIIRHLYDLLFRWLIKSVNEMLSGHLRQCNRLGILDIFGFECFNTNGIEQVCVNYANEKLQQYFIEKYVTFCQRDLQEEKDVFEEVKLSNCSDILQLYKDRLNTVRQTLFAALNDICLSTVPCDTGTLIQHVNAMLSSAHSSRRFLKVKNEKFVIRHYAGDVEYSCDDLFSKNTDKVPDELTITFSMSRNKFLHLLIADSDVYGESSVKKRTMLSKLCYNVNWLIRELNECDAHYVRCVKLRRKEGSTNWDRRGLYKQLDNMGVLYSLSLPKCKYPVYFRYEDFGKRYNWRTKNSGNCRELVMKIVDITSEISDSFPLTGPGELSPTYCGKNYIFIREDAFSLLEDKRRKCKSVKKIETFWIQYKTRQLEVKRTDAPANITEASSPPRDNEKNVVVSNDQSKSPLTYGINLVAPQLGKSNTGRNVTECAKFMCAVFSCDNKTPLQIPEPTYIQQKTSYIMKWLKDISETTNIMESTEATVPEQSSVTHDLDQSAATSCSNDSPSKSAGLNGDRIGARRKREKISGYYDKENDMYIIPHGSYTLFHKNRILSRHHPTRLPVKVRVTCLTNSHYSLHTELPQGLQDCL